MRIAHKFALAVWCCAACWPAAAQIARARDVTLVEGRGEPSAYGSASHGAGRVLTRKQAHREIAPDRTLGR